jgi:hypothetical protein
MIVIGLGTGRSGTASLAQLLNAQRNSFCFHEMNPAAVRFSDTPRPFLNSIDEFQTILDGGDPRMLTVDLSRPVAARAYEQLCRVRQLRLIGDIAFYYLNYVELIAARNHNVRFICLRRDREQTIRSWLRKTEIDNWPSKRIANRLSSVLTRTPYVTSYNYWMEHDGSRWRLSPVWDKCFPKFDATTKRDAVAQYWDFYYEKAEVFARKFDGIFKIFDIEDINHYTIQTELLEYCGIPLSEQVRAEAHVHRSADKLRPSMILARKPFAMLSALLASYF